MKVAFDSNVLTFLFSKSAKASIDPNSNKPVENPILRVQTLTDRLIKERAKIIIPTPVLSEILVPLKEKGPALVAKLDRDSNFEFVPFDVKASIELAQINYLYGKDTKSGNSWAKVKFDRQILAICKVNNVELIFSDDKHVCSLANELGMRHQSIYELPLPEKNPQGSLPLDTETGE